MRTWTKSLLFLCLLFTFVTAASAKTPDGQPPSQESVCDGQVGAAYGLCNAYCEAMDCDSANPQASPTACAKVRANFMKHTGQAPPCDCPCVSQLPGWIDIVNGPIVSCTDLQAPDQSSGLTYLQSDQGQIVTSQFSVDAPENSSCTIFLVSRLQLNAQQGMACASLLAQRAAAAGITCSH